MSETSLKTITDRAGTGSPNFSQGVKISGADSGLLAPTRTEGDTQPDAETSSNGDTFYDTVNDTYDILIEDAWVRLIGEGGAPAVVNWTVDVSNATYDNVSFSVGSQATNPTTIIFSPDGSKMFVNCYSTDSLYQYSLSTGFDITTASYDSTLSFASQDATPVGIALSTDGTKMYMMGGTADDVFQYSLSTAFDISTMSYDGVSYSITASFPQGITFSPDGTKMFIVTTDADRIFQYGLSTAWDVSTASYETNRSVQSNEVTPRGLSFNPEGTKLYVIGSSSDAVFSYSLSTAFDLDTSVDDNLNVNVASQEANPKGVTFNNDGTKMYIIGAGDVIYQYSTGL